jgi:hypothetical protein
MPVTTHTLLVAYRLGEGLAKGYADVLDGVMRVNVQITFGDNLQIEHAVTRHLVEHMVEEAYSGGKPGASGAVQIQANLDLGLQGISVNLGLAHGYIEYCVT